MMKCILILLSLFSIDLRAAEINFFESEINFWYDSKKMESSPKKETDKKPAESKFPWKEYLDPKNKEFFKEGDYTPPEPFMEVARNPTNENIKNWFELMQKKNEIQTRLQKRMAEYMALQQKDLSMESSKKVLFKANKEFKEVDASRFRIRMFFDSQCPHCKKMFHTLERFQQEGFSVEALQIDAKRFDTSITTVKILKATAEDLQKNKIESVPLVLVADVKNKIILPPITGYHEYADVMQMLLEISQK